MSSLNSKDMDMLDSSDASEWSTWPATQTVDFDEHGIENLTSISGNGVEIVTFDEGNMKMLEELNMNREKLDNIGGLRYSTQLSQPIITNYPLNFDVYSCEYLDIRMNLTLETENRQAGNLMEVFMLNETGNSYDVTPNGSWTWVDNISPPSPIAMLPGTYFYFRLFCLGSDETDIVVLSSGYY